MPAYNYFPATYQNPYYQQYSMPPQYQQTVQQPVMQQTQQQQIQNGIIWVSGDEEAMAYPIAPNNAVRLWHSSLPIVYFKSADASGKPSIKAYELVERAEKASVSVSQQESRVTDYATKDDLAALSRVVDGLKDEVKSFRKKKRNEVGEDDE